MTPTPPRFRVGIIGVGRAGSVLGAALDRAGHRVVRVHAVGEVSQLRAQSLLPEAKLGTIEDVLADSELVLVTVPDDVLSSLVTGLAELGQFHGGHVVVHASGRYGVGVLNPATRCGAVPLALHPVMTLTGTSLDLDRLTGVPFGVTAPEPLRAMAEALVVEMGGDPVWVAEVDRSTYHAALANASNHLVTLTNQSLDLLRAAGVAAPSRLLAPLMQASLDNALRLGDQALTGPVMRGDAVTVAEHLRRIGMVDTSSQQAYRAMARLTADRAMAAGILAPTRAEALLDVLSEEE